MRKSEISLSAEEMKELMLLQTKGITQLSIEELKETAYLKKLIHQFDFVDFINRQHAFSQCTFGPGERTEGVLAHIAKEAAEVCSNPDDVFEWVDIILLAIDGALRRGFSAYSIVLALQKKLDINKARRWPDWRTAPVDSAIEHLKKD